MEKKVLAIITARGGSKGVPRKAVVTLAGKPLIAWTIEAARSATSLNRVIVSTDDEEIAEVCRKLNAEVPFMRPEELAQDDSPHADVVIHALSWLEENENYRPDYVMLLQPDSPLRTSEDIDAAVTLALEKNADAVVGVCEAPAHPFLVRRIVENGTLVDFIDKPEGYLRRQAFPPAYSVNGAIYLIRRETLLEEKTLEAENALPYIMPPERSLDIDEPRDLHLAELIIKDRQEKMGY